MTLDISVIVLMQKTSDLHIESVFINGTITQTNNH
jgi:hypothetical protein